MLQLHGGKKSSLRYIFLICGFGAGSIMLKSLIGGPGFPSRVFQLHCKWFLIWKSRDISGLGQRMCLPALSFTLLSAQGQHSRICQLSKHLTLNSWHRNDLSLF